MKSKIWVIIILAAAALAAGIIYYVNQPPGDFGPVSVHHKSQSPAATDLSGWQTYTNSQYGFSFSYPADLNPEFLDDASEPLVSLEVSSGDILTFYPKGHSGYDIDPASTMTQKQISLSGQGAEETIYTADSGGLYLISVVFQEPLKDYPNFEIQLTAKDTLTEDSLSLFGQIITSFKLIQPQAGMSGWKTYTNSQYGYQVSYPAGLGNFEDNFFISYSPFKTYRCVLNDGTIRYSPFGIDDYNNGGGYLVGQAPDRCQDLSFADSVKYNGGNIPASQIALIPNDSSEIYISEYPAMQPVGNGNFEEKLTRDVRINVEALGIKTPEGKTLAEISFGPKNQDSITDDQLKAIFETFQFIQPQADMNGWQTYTNSQYGFSFKYPETWTASSSQDGSNYVWFLSPEANAAMEQNFESPPDLGLYLDPNKNHLTAMDYYDGNNAVALFDGGSASRKIEVSGQVAYKVYPATGIAASVDVIIPQKDFFIRFETYGDESQLDQILSTFKFTK